MDEIDGRLEDHATLRILLVPVGGISTELFNQYCRLFESTSTLAISTLTQPDHWAASRSPFKHFTWQDGALKLRWIRSAGTTSVNGSVSGQWANFAAHRQVFGVMGILHFPTWQAACEAQQLQREGDSSSSEDAASNVNIASQLQAALECFCSASSSNDRNNRNTSSSDSSDSASIGLLGVKRVCVFGRTVRSTSSESPSSSFDGGGVNSVLPLTLALGRESVAIFPPDEWNAAAKEAIGHQSLRIVELHAQITLNDLGAELFLAIEELVRTALAEINQAQGSASMQLACSLRSPLDDEPYYAAREAIGSSLSVRAAAEPQRQLSGTSIAAVRADKLAKGRLRKRAGDLCLLAASPLDAAKHYAAAVQVAKAANDPLWQAGALLGLCAATHEVIISRHRRRYGRAPMLQPPIWDRTAWETLEATAASGASTASAGAGAGNAVIGATMTTAAPDANATLGSALDDARDDADPIDDVTGTLPPPPPPLSELSINSSPGQATRAALTRTQSEAELISGAAAVEINRDLEYSGREEYLPKCLEELALVLPEFKECSSNASSSSSTFSLKLGLKKSNSGKEASMDDSARLKSACKEVDAFLKVVGSSCGEAVRVLEPLAVGSAYSHSSSHTSSSRLHALGKIPPSPAAAAFLAEVCFKAARVEGLAVVPHRPLEALAWANKALTAATATAAAAEASKAMETATSSFSSATGGIHDAVVSSMTHVGGGGVASASSSVQIAAPYASLAPSAYSRHHNSSSGSSSSGTGVPSKSKYQGSGWGQQVVAEEVQPISGTVKWGPRDVAQLYVEASLLCRDCDAALSTAHTNANDYRSSMNQSTGSSTSGTSTVPSSTPPLRNPWVSLRRKRAFFLQQAAQSLAEAGSFRDAFTVGAIATAAYEEQSLQTISSPTNAGSGGGSGQSAGAATEQHLPSPQRRRRPPPPWRDRGTGWWSLKVALLEGKVLLADCIRAADAAAAASVAASNYAVIGRAQAVLSPNGNSADHLSAVEVALAAAGTAVGIGGGRSGTRVPGTPELRLAVAEMVASLELDFPLLEPLESTDDGGNVVKSNNSTTSNSTNVGSGAPQLGSAHEEEVTSSSSIRTDAGARAPPAVYTIMQSSVVPRTAHLTGALPSSAHPVACLGAFGRGPWGAQAHGVDLPPTVAAAAIDKDAEVPFNSKLAAAGGSGSGSSADALSQLLPIPIAPKPLLSSSAAAEEAASAAAPLIAAQKAALQSLLQGNSSHDNNNKGSKKTSSGSNHDLNHRSPSSSSSGVFERRRGAAVASRGHWSADEQAKLLRELAADALAAPPWAGAWSSLPFALPPEPDAGTGGHFQKLPLPLPSAVSSTLRHLHASLGGGISYDVHAVADNLPSSSTSSRLLRVVSLRPLRSSQALPLPMPRAMRVVAEAAAALRKRTLNPNESSWSSTSASKIDAASVSFLYSPFAKAEKEDELRCVAGEPLDLCLRVVNPFAVPLVLQSAAACVSGPSTSCVTTIPKQPLLSLAFHTESSITASLAASSNSTQGEYKDSSEERHCFRPVPVATPLKLTVTPHEYGSLTVEGAWLRCANITSFARVSLDGSPMNVWPTDVPYAAIDTSGPSKTEARAHHHNGNHHLSTRRGNNDLQRRNADTISCDPREVPSTRILVVRPMPLLVLQGSSDTSAGEAANAESNAGSQGTIKKCLPREELHETMSLWNAGSCAVGWLQVWVEGMGHDGKACGALCLAHVDCDGIIEDECNDTIGGEGKINEDRFDEVDLLSTGGLNDDSKGETNRLHESKRAIGRESQEEPQGKSIEANLEQAIINASNSATSRSVQPFNAAQVMALRKQLPLQPGATLHLNIPYVAQDDVSKLTFSVAYASPQVQLPSSSSSFCSSSGGSPSTSVSSGSNNESEERWIRRVASSVTLLPSTELQIVGVDILPGPWSHLLQQAPHLPLATLEALEDSAGVDNDNSSVGITTGVKDSSVTSDAATCLAIVTVANAKQEPVVLTLHAPIGLQSMAKTASSKAAAAVPETTSAPPQPLEYTRVAVGPGATTRIVVTLPRLAWPPSSLAYTHSPAHALWGAPHLTLPLSDEAFLPLPQNATAAEAEAHAVSLKAARINLASLSKCYFSPRLPSSQVDASSKDSSKFSSLPPPSKERVGEVAVALAKAANANDLALSLGEAERVGVRGSLVDHATCRLALLLHLGTHLACVWEKVAPPNQKSENPGSQDKNSTALLLNRPPMLQHFCPMPRRGMLPLVDLLSLENTSCRTGATNLGGESAEEGKSASQRENVALEAAVHAIKPPVELEVRCLPLPSASDQQDVPNAFSIAAAAAAAAESSEVISESTSSTTEMNSRKALVNAASKNTIEVTVGQVLRLKFTVRDVRELQPLLEAAEEGSHGTSLGHSQNDTTQPFPLQVCLSPMASREGDAWPSTLNSDESSKPPPMYWAGNLKASTSLIPSSSTRRTTLDNESGVLRTTGTDDNDSATNGGEVKKTPSEYSFESAVCFAESGNFTIGLRCAYHAGMLGTRAGVLTSDDVAGQGEVGSESNWSVVVSSSPLLVHCKAES